jgi:Leucine-rich repeat (LRR) protein
MFIRLSLETKGSESNEIEWMSLQAQRSLRTLISVGHIKIKPCDSLDTFSCLWTLHIQGANVDGLAKSLVQLKHLRYLSIENTNISMLPENIGKMMLLQYICLYQCRSLTKLPGSIGQLQYLRFLNFHGTRINNVPKGLNGLTNLRILHCFPAHMDGHLSSLEELGPLSKLIDLSINGLENIPSSSFARKTKLSEKFQLRNLYLICTGRHGDDDPMLKEDKNTSNKRQQQIEEVFDELRPPQSLENLNIKGYFGRRLPRWMMLAVLGM